MSAVLTRIRTRPPLTLTLRWMPTRRRSPRLPSDSRHRSPTCGCNVRPDGVRRSEPAARW